MSENKSKDHNSQSDNDEDFGLPPVNVSPLKSDPPKLVADQPAVPVAQESGSSSVPDAGKNPEKKEKKDRTNWVILLILLFILAVGYGVYHFGLMEDFNRNTPEATAEDTTPPAVESPEPEPSPEPEAAIPETEEPTTAPQLTEIEGREGSPRYFLVVGSFIDDDLARDYSSRLNNSGLNTFLVHPYGNINFYRLAVGQFENLDLALEAMESSQNDYKENLWVLKY